MNLFCLNWYNGAKITLELNEVIGFPNNTSIEGGYDIVCTLIIDSGCYHIEYDQLYSATGTLYRFLKELNACYTDLFGSAEYHSLYENDLTFKVEMFWQFDFFRWIYPCFHHFYFSKVLCKFIMAW